MQSTYFFKALGSPGRMCVCVYIGMGALGLSISSTNLGFPRKRITLGVVCVSLRIGFQPLPQWALDDCKVGTVTGSTSQKIAIFPMFPTENDHVGWMIGVWMRGLVSSSLSLWGIMQTYGNLTGPRNPRIEGSLIFYILISGPGVIHWLILIGINSPKANIIGLMQ